MKTLSILILMTGGTIEANIAHENIKEHGRELGGLGLVIRGDSTDSPRSIRPLSSADPALFTLLQATLRYIVKERSKDEEEEIQVALDVLALQNIDSTDLGPKTWIEISDTIANQYDSYQCFVITHGTNTMGYTCAALSFAMENLGKPVVVTGSQIPFGWTGSDALTNLQNALRVSATRGLRGVIGVFGSHIIAGTRVKKNNEFDYDAFQSFSSAGLGRIGREIRWTEANLQRHHEYLKDVASIGSELEVSNAFDDRVLSFTEFPGMRADMFEDIIRGQVAKGSLRGIVFRAFGAGDVSTSLHGVFQTLQDLSIPIIVTTQAPNGVSSLDVNDPGKALKRADLAIAAYDMSIESMTTKMMWLLGKGLGYKDICERMPRNLRGEVSPPSTAKTQATENLQDMSE